MASDLLAWASAGYVTLTPHDIHRVRITGLTVTPASAGVLLMLSVMLWQPGARRKHATA